MSSHKVANPMSHCTLRLEWSICSETLILRGTFVPHVTGKIRKIPKREEPEFFGKMAGVTGFEPAAFAVTGRRCNQLNYTPAYWEGLGLFDSKSLVNQLHAAKLPAMSIGFVVGMARCRQNNCKNELRCFPPELVSK